MSQPLPASPKYDIESLDVNKNLGVGFGGGARRAVGVQKDRVMQLFGSPADFIRIHQQIQPLEDFEDED